MAGGRPYRRRDVLKTLGLLPAALDIPGQESQRCAIAGLLLLDLKQSLQVTGFANRAPPRYETPEEALKQSSPGSGVLILVESYPVSPTELSVRFIE